MILVHGTNEHLVTAILKHLGERARLFAPSVHRLQEFRKCPELMTVEAQEAGWAEDYAEYILATTMIDAESLYAKKWMVAKGQITYRNATECAPVNKLVQSLGLSRISVGGAMPLYDYVGISYWIPPADYCSWQEWPALQNTGEVPAVVVADFDATANAMSIPRYDEQWRRVLDGCDNIEVYGSGWRAFTGWDKKRFMGPVSREEGSRLLSRALCTPIVNWQSTTPYQAIAAGCFPMYLHSAPCFKEALKAFLSYPAGWPELLQAAANRLLQPDWSALDDRIRMD